jgi:hypothetical protein
MGSGFRTFASGEVLTSDNVQNFLMDQAVMVFAGTAARGSALPSPETGMTAYSTATGLQVYDGDDWVDVSTGYGVATLSGVGAGTATITDVVSYTLLTAINDGTLTVTKAGLFDVLLVAGGGAGGSGTIVGGFGTGGGGGGGGVLRQTIYLDAAAYTVDVGAGGTGGATTISAVMGKPTVVRSATQGVSFAAAGGGAGDNRIGAFRIFHPLVGGCGGGGGNTGRVGSSGIVGQGFAGGTGGTSGTYAGGGGGGGGASAVGANGSGNVGGAGGAGLTITSFVGGAATIRGGGGGGGGQGGNGAEGTGNGAANTGGGGNGRSEANGTSGRSGVAYIRFKS